MKLGKKYDEEDDDDDLTLAIELAKLTAGNVSGISEQLGLIATTMKKHEIEIRENKNEIKEVKDDVNLFKEQVRDSQYLRPEQVDEIEIAAKKRVGRLLQQISQDAYDKYYGKFMSKLWWDAKASRLLIGEKHGRFTPQRNYDAAIDYINSWTPYMYGVPGYIQHLEDSKRRKELNQNV